MNDSNTSIRISTGAGRDSVEAQGAGIADTYKQNGRGRWIALPRI